MPEARSCGSFALLPIFQPLAVASPHVPTCRVAKIQDMLPSSKYKSDELGMVEASTADCHWGGKRGMSEGREALCHGIGLSRLLCLVAGCLTANEITQCTASPMY